MAKRKLVRREIEIFAVGTWSHQKFATGDLREIVENFLRLKEVHRPPLKLGHSTNQLLEGQSDGDPALGWVEWLRMSNDGRKLLATIEIPPAVDDLIEARLYDNVSVELFFDVMLEGKRIGTVLRAVALIGADIPAVSDLAALRRLAASASPVPGWAGAANFQAFTARNGVVQDEDAKEPESEENHMDLERAITDLAETVRKLGIQFSAQGSALLEEECKRKGAETELARFKQVETQTRETERFAAYQTRRGSILEKLDSKVSAGVITPDIRRRFAAEIDGQVADFKPGGQLTFSADLVLEMAELLSPKLPQGEQGRAGADAAGKSAGDEIAVKIAEHRRANPGLNYAAAFSQVLSLNPELSARHAAETEFEQA